MCAEASSPIRQNGYYQVVVAGKIDASWSEWFGGVRIDWQEEADGRCVTILGILADQAALRGLLNRLWDLNLALIAVRQVDPSEKPTVK